MRHTISGKRMAGAGGILLVMMMAFAPLSVSAQSPAAPPLLEASKSDEFSQIDSQSYELAGVLVGENFSSLELITTGLVFPAGVALTLFGGRIWEQPAPSMNSPDPKSMDYRISKRFHGDLETGKPLLWGVPDYAAYVMGTLPSLYYLTSSGYLLSRGEPLFGFQDHNFHHRTLAFAEAYGWTALITVGAKFFVGRPRPYVALDRPAYAWNSHEENLSFFSGHASLSFAASTFLYRSLSDSLVHKHLSEWGDMSRFLVGRALPFVTLYGTATLIGVSRVYDQKHYTSDVLMGAVVGTLVSTLVYNSHFDDNGNPRRRYAKSVMQSAAITPTLLSDGHSSVPGWSMGVIW